MISEAGLFISRPVIIGFRERRWLRDQPHGLTIQTDINLSLSVLRLIDYNLIFLRFS